jgi:hypothetical protein
MIMPKSVKRKALLAWLEGCIRKDEGYVTQVIDQHDDKLLVIVHNTPYINGQADRRIVDILTSIVRQRLVRLVATDGGYGDVDTSWVKLDDRNMAKGITDELFRTGKLTAVEYVHMNMSSTVPFDLFGAEDKELHEKSILLWNTLEPLWTFLSEDPTPSQVQRASSTPRLGALFPKMYEFIDIEKLRAEAICDNVLRKMEELHLDVAVVVCKGNLPELLLDEAKSRSISCAEVNILRAREKDDLSTYKESLASQASDLRKPVSREARPPGFGGAIRERLGRLHLARARGR